MSKKKVDLTPMRENRPGINATIIGLLEEVLACTGLPWFDRTHLGTNKDEGIVSVGWCDAGFPMTLYVTPDAHLGPSNKRFKLWGQGGGLMCTNSFHEDSDLIGCFDDLLEMFTWFKNTCALPSNIVTINPRNANAMGLLNDDIDKPLFFTAWVRWAIEARQCYHFEDDPAQQVRTGSNGVKCFNAREVRQLHAVVRLAEHYGIDLCEIYMRITAESEGRDREMWFKPAAVMNLMSIS